jgi:hypothetical protein
MKSLKALQSKELLQSIHDTCWKVTCSCCQGLEVDKWKNHNAKSKQLLKKPLVSYINSILERTPMCKLWHLLEWKLFISSLYCSCLKILISKPKDRNLKEALRALSRKLLEKPYSHAVTHSKFYSLGCGSKLGPLCIILTTASTEIR